jgi:hypothetical protein
MNMRMQLIYSKSFMMMTKACKSIMGSKVPATSVCVYPAHLCCFRIRMLCRVVGQGDQSGSMMSQLYLWTLAMHVSHLPVPDVMLLRHHCYKVVAA